MIWGTTIFGNTHVAIEKQGFNIDDWHMDIHHSYAIFTEAMRKYFGQGPMVWRAFFGLIISGLITGSLEVKLLTIWRVFGCDVFFFFGGGFDDFLGW